MSHCHQFGSVRIIKGYGRRSSFFHRGFCTLGGLFKVLRIRSDDKAAPHRVITAFQQFVSGVVIDRQLHAVRMECSHLVGTERNVLAPIKRERLPVAERESLFLLHGADHLRYGRRVHGFRRLSHQSEHGCTVGGVALAGGAEAPHQIDREPRRFLCRPRLFQFMQKKSRRPHGTHGVAGARPDADAEHFKNTDGHSHP